ncbi:glycine cleavage system aminomethyltransferase GcvT [Candidatus Fermentibacteria bacterium]|nr:glycine cleavage system aminomethyltransferase GcvT [Candidatus Fermentibacteria bacterium]
MSQIKKTQLTSEHERLGGKMVEFGGWWMPVRFRGIVEEHQAVRSGAGLFDVSHMGEILITGPDALRFTNTIVTNNVEKLEPDQALYTCMCYQSGGIVDDLLVYRLPEGYLLVVNAANTEKDYGWIVEHAEGDIQIANESDDYIQIALQGPRAAEILAPLTDENLDAIRFYHYAKGDVTGLPAIISRTGYTGEDGFEVYLKGGEAEAARVWRALLEQGKPFGLVPIGLGARDTLRLEMGYMLYGNDITQDTTPLEAGLGWVTKLKKGPFIGRDALLRQKEQGLRKSLIAFTVEGRSAPRHGYPLLLDGETHGEVTSGTFSPSLERGIGLGYLSTEAQAREGILAVNIRGKSVPASRVSLPFYKQGSHL